MQKLTIRTGNQSFIVEMEEQKAEKIFLKILFMLINENKSEIEGSGFKLNLSGQGETPSCDCGHKHEKVPAPEPTHSPNNVILVPTDIPESESYTAPLEAVAQNDIAPTQSYHSYPIDQGYQNSEGYSGFLMIRCQHCGKIHGRALKQRTTSFRCPDCQGETALSDLKTLYMNCPNCGKNARYKTNMDPEEGIFDVICLQCSSPVSIIYNERYHIFSTVEEKRARKKY